MYSRYQTIFGQERGYWPSYGKPFGKNDTISIILDLKKQEIKFFKELHIKILRKKME